MPSSDFILDLTSKLEKQGYNYLLLTLFRNKKENSVDTYFNFDSEDSAMIFVEILEEIQNNICEQVFSDQEKKKGKKPDKNFEDLLNE